jgi:hypothetical protein
VGLSVQVGIRLRYGCGCSILVTLTELALKIFYGATSKIALALRGEARPLGQGDNSPKFAQNSIPAFPRTAPKFPTTFP